MTNAELKEYALEEVQLLSRLDHPNIVRYKEFFRNGSILHLVMEYCNGGDLAAFLLSMKQIKRFIDEDVILKLTLQMAVGLRVS